MVKVVLSILPVVSAKEKVEGLEGIKGSIILPRTLLSTILHFTKHYPFAGGDHRHLTHYFHTNSMLIRYLHISIPGSCHVSSALTLLSLSDTVNLW